MAAGHVSKVPCTSESLAHSLLTSFNQSRRVGAGGLEPFLPHPAIGKRLFQIVLWLGRSWHGQVLGSQGSQCGRQSSQACDGESNQPVFKSWLCCGSLGESSNLSKLQSPVQNADNRAGPHRVAVRSSRHNASKAPSAQLTPMRGCCSHYGGKNGGQEGKDWPGVTELGPPVSQSTLFSAPWQTLSTYCLHPSTYGALYSHPHPY